MTKSSQEGKGDRLESNAVLQSKPRRKLLRQAAGVGGISMVAGCTGMFSGGEGTTEMAIPPLGFYNLAFNYLEESGRDQEIFDEYGVDINVRRTWEDATLYSGGQVDIGVAGPPDLVSMGEEEGEKHINAGSILYPVLGWLTKAGGPYDPEETGGRQETMDKVYEDGGNVAVGAWSGGSVLFAKFAWQELFGYDFSEDGDFNTTSADFEAVCQLLQNDEIALGESSPAHGCVDAVMNDDVSPLYWETDLFIEQDWGLPILGGVHARESFVEDNEDAMKAAVELWDEGFGEVRDNVEQYKEDESSVEAMAVENQEQAAFAIEFFFEAEHGLENSPVPTEVSMTEEKVTEQEEILDIFAEQGSITEDWDQYVGFEIYDIGGE